MAKLVARPTRPAPRPSATTAPPRPDGPGAPVAPAAVSVTVRNATSRQGLAARVTAGLTALGFKATNGGNAPPSATTRLAHAPGTDGAASTLARAVKTGGRVARSPQPGLAQRSVVLVLGADFNGLASRVVPAKPPATRPPKPTPATRDLPPWDPRPC